MSSGMGDLLLLSRSPTQTGGFPSPDQSAHTPQAGRCLCTSCSSQVLPLLSYQQPACRPLCYTGCVSAPVFPLRPRPPAVGATPFKELTPFSIAEAWETAAGLLRAVLWCLTDTTAAANSSSSSAGQHHRAGGKSAWVCETWLVTLSAHEVTPLSGQQQELQVLDCQLLLVSRAPPAAAVACAAADKLLLVAEPGLEEGELPAGRVKCPARQESWPVTVCSGCLPALALLQQRGCWWCRRGQARAAFAHCVRPLMPAACCLLHRLQAAAGSCDGLGGAAAAAARQHSHGNRITSSSSSRHSSGRRDN